MRRWLVWWLVLGCGRTNTLTLPSADAGSRFDCRATCELVKPQLVRDFEIPASSIDCASFPADADCAACRLVFVQRFGISTQCQ